MWLVRNSRGNPVSHAATGIVPRSRRVLRLCAAFALLVVAVAAAAAVSAVFTHGEVPPLSVDQEPVAADFIYVLMGEAEPRVSRAAELYHQGYAPLILFPETDRAGGATSPVTTAYALRLAQELDVPSNATRIVPFSGGVRTTRDEICALRRVIERSAATSVIVVTSAYHTKRAWWTVRRQLAGMPVEFRVVAAPSISSTSRSGLRLYGYEHLKLLPTVLDNRCNAAPVGSLHGLRDARFASVRAPRPEPAGVAPRGR
jgi:uncharacterized SAM-binding protein YcdF (DUF218 family)